MRTHHLSINAVTRVRSMSFAEKMRSFKISLKFNHEYRKEVSDILQHKKAENYIELFDIVQEWFATKDVDTRKYYTMYAYMTYVDKNSYQYTHLSESLRREYESLIQIMESDSESFAVDKARSIMSQLERETIDHMMSHMIMEISTTDNDLTRNKSIIWRYVKIIRDKINKKRSL